MLDKIKKSDIISFFALLIILIAQIAFIPVLFNYKRVWGIGYYKFKKDFVSDYPDGSVGIEIKINLDHEQSTGVVRIRSIASGNVQVHGITHIQYEILVGTGRFSLVNEIVDPAAQSWSNGFRVSLYKDENVTCKGTAEVNFSIGGLDQIIVLNFDMSYVIPMNVGDIYYKYDLPFLYIYMFYFAFLFVVVYYVHKKYKYIKFQYSYTEEMKKRDKEFFEYIEKIVGRKKKEEE